MLTDEQRRVLIHDLKHLYKKGEIHILFDWDREMFGFEGNIEYQDDYEDDVEHNFCERCNTTVLNPLYVFIIKRLIRAGLLDEDYKTQCCTCKMFERILEQGRENIFLDYIVQTNGKLGHKPWLKYIENLAECEEFSILKDTEFQLKLENRLREYVNR